MPVYRFRCRACGDFDSAFPMASVPDAGPCPSCGAAAARTVTAPAIGRGSSPAMRAVDAARRTASEPAVVSGPPPGRRARATPVTAHPLHRTLPRP